MSNTSLPPLRLELHVSRRLRVALIVLGVLAGIAVLRSGLPWPAIVLVPLLVWQAQRALQRHGTTSLLLRADGTAARLLPHDEAMPIEPKELIERGPLALFVFAEGTQVSRIAAAVDVLDAATRRDVRLWFARHRRPAHAAGGGTHV